MLFNCPRCNNKFTVNMEEMNASSSFVCPQCGASFSLTASWQQQSYNQQPRSYQQPYQQSNQQPYYQQPQMNNGFVAQAPPVLVTGKYAAPSMKDAIKMFFKRYVDFKGRSRRAEVWKMVLWNLMFMGGFILLILIAYLLDGLLPKQYEWYGWYDWNGDYVTDGYYRRSEILTQIACVASAAVYGLYALASFVPSLALYARRLHDVHMSELWLLLLIVPGGGLFFLVIACVDGKPEPNQWGMSPKYAIAQQSPQAVQ